jgi:D-serine deaminase-like pyridoxal phosphate-dependent protein
LTRLSDLETPVLTADLDAVQRNVAGMQRYCDEHELALRPHIKDATGTALSAGVAHPNHFIADLARP